MTPAGERPGAVVNNQFKLSTSKISLNADARNGESADDKTHLEVVRWKAATE